MASNSELEQKKPLIEQFRETRHRTLELVKTLEKDDFVIQTAFFMSPPKWHIGHVSWIYEAIISKLDKNYEFYSKEFSDYLNSYYQQFGTPQDKGLRGISSRPTIDQIFQYFNTINQRVEKFIESKSLNENEIKLITMGFHHECQHQELLVYDLQHLLAEQYRPTRKNEIIKHENVEKKSVQIKGGLYTMGYNGENYCYDIELPEHKVYLNDYKIDTFPITNQQFMEFIKDGGYENYKYWLSDGWEKVKTNKWNAPMYWEKIDGEWNVRDFLGIRRKSIQTNQYVMLVTMKQMHTVNGQEKDYLQKLNGKKQHVGMKKNKKKQHTHGEMNYQQKTNVIYLNHIFGDAQRSDHFLMG